MTSPPDGYVLRFTNEAASVLAELKKVNKALGQLQRDPRDPALNSHKYSSLRGNQNEDVWDSYVENNTPSAWRIFWHFGPERGVITIITIGPHP